MTFSQCIIALKQHEPFAVLFEEIKNRQRASLLELTTAQGVEISRLQGQYRAFSDLIQDIERAEELAKLVSDNAKIPRARAQNE